MISAIAIALAYWIPAEMNKPPPEIREGVIDGYFDGQVRYWDAYAVKSKGFNESCASRHGIGSYNQSWVHMWGSIKYNDGSIEDASIEGKEIRGALCILDVDNNIFASSTNKETPGVIYFRGEVREMPQLQISAETLVIIALVGVIFVLVYIVYYKKSSDFFSAKEALQLIRMDLERDGYQLVGMGEAKETEGALEGTSYTVKQRVLGKPNKIMIRHINDKRKITNLRENTTNNSLDTHTFDKGAEEFHREMLTKEKPWRVKDEERRRERLNPPKKKEVEDDIRKGRINDNSDETGRV